VNALDLVSEIVRQAACTVIADLVGDDPRLVERCQARNLGFVQAGRNRQMRGAIDIPPGRYAGSGLQLA
jgi:hypothetical protein